MAVSPVVTQIISFVVMTILASLILMLSAKIFKLKDQSFMTALKIVLIIYVITFVLSLIGLTSLSVALIMAVLSFVVMVVLGIYLIKTFYKLKWGKSILVWLVWFILAWIVGAIVGAILVVIGLIAA